MDNPLFWSMAHALAFIVLISIIIVRPGYWAGSINWLSAVALVLLSTVRGKVAPRGARTRWQFTCLVCGAAASAMTALSYLALSASLPHAAVMVGFGRCWMLLIVMAFALGSLSTGRDGHAV
jgi:hypothetical protein